MSGYRQSGYDPDAYQQIGRPLRPYNRWQWAGVVLGVAGMAIYLVYLAGRIGWLPPLIDQPAGGFFALIGGSILVNSRREPSSDITPEQRAANRRMLVITIAISVAVVGLATLIEFAGAN